MLQVEAKGIEEKEVCLLEIMPNPMIPVALDILAPYL
jgi:hypothetical protein